MDKITFLRELERCLQGISQEERQEAVSYYENYFEDAGIENEASVLAELGSPEAVAKTILAELEETSNRNNSTTILLCILLVLTSPVWLGVVLGLIGTIVGVLVAIAALVIGFGLSAGICVVAGVAVFVFGVFRLFFVPLEGMACFGGGLLTFGIGILFFLGMLLLVKLIELVCKGIKWGCKTLFPKKTVSGQGMSIS